MRAHQMASGALLVAALVQGGQALALDPVYSGGSTLASKVYRQIFDCFGKDVPPGVNPTGCTTPNVETYPQTLYAPVGSGAGQNAFVHNDPTLLGTPAASNTVPYTSPNFPAYPYPAIDMAGSDNELTATLLSTYNSAAWGNAKQVPMFMTAVALPFNSGPGSNGASADTFTHPVSVTLPSGASARFRLQRRSVCGIFTGAITDWRSALLTADNGGTPLVATPTPIKVVIRHDGSGTTALFSRFLNAACASTAFPYTGTVGTKSADAFSQLLANNPANVIQADGSGGVRDTIQTTDFSISYVSPDFVKQVRDANNAVLTGGDPTGPVFANLQNKYGGYRAPSIGNTKAGLASSTPPDSHDDNALDWGQPAGSDDPTASGAYPIIGFTFMETYTCYKPYDPKPQNPGQTALDLTRFFNWYFHTRITMNSAILANNGFASVPVAYANALNDLLTVNADTKIATRGAAGTACAGVSPGA